MLIYELKNPKKPILQFTKGEVEECLIGFFTVIDQNLTVFTLRSDNYLYEI
jgi:hypothetical protein